MSLGLEFVPQDTQTTYGDTHGLLAVGVFL